MATSRVQIECKGGYYLLAQHSMPRFGLSTLAVCVVSTMLSAHAASPPPKDMPNHPPDTFSRTQGAAGGTEVTVNFSGVIASSSGPNAQQFHVGEHVTGSYTLRTKVSDDVPGNPNEGRYRNTLVAAKVMIQESGLSFSHARGPGVANDISVFKTAHDDQVAIFAWSRTGGSFLGGETPCCVEIDFSAPKSTDKNRQMLVDDSLPIHPLAYAYANISLGTKAGWTKLMITPEPIQAVDSQVVPEATTPRFTRIGNDMMVDSRTGLQLAQSDNGADINWNDANNWCSQKGGGFRLPSPEELRPLVGKPKEFRLTGDFYWTNWRHGSYQAWMFSLQSGNRHRYGLADYSHNFRALCVRMPKQE